MKIDSSGQWQMYGKMNNLYTQPKYGHQDSKVAKKNQDVLSFSGASYKPPEAVPSKSLQVKTLQTMVSPKIDKRVEEIKLQVEKGTYSVPRQAVVDAILSKCRSENI